MQCWALEVQRCKSSLCTYGTHSLLGRGWGAVRLINKQKTTVQMDKCSDGGVGKWHRNSVGWVSWLYSLKKMKMILCRGNERYWDIFWKSRKILITKLTGQNGSGKANKGSLRTLLWSAAICGFFSNDPSPHPSSILPSFPVTQLKSKV